MTVIPFPPASARPKPGKEPPEVSAQILVLPVIRIERDLLPPDVLLVPPDVYAFLVGSVVSPAAAGSD